MRHVPSRPGSPGDVPLLPAVRRPGPAPARGPAPAPVSEPVPVPVMPAEGLPGARLVPPPAPRAVRALALWRPPRRPRMAGQMSARPPVARPLAAGMLAAGLLVAGLLPVELPATGQRARRATATLPWTVPPVWSARSAQRSRPAWPGPHGRPALPGQLPPPVWMVLRAPRSGPTRQEPLRELRGLTVSLCPWRTDSSRASLRRSGGRSAAEEEVPPPRQKPPVQRDSAAVPAWAQAACHHLA